MCGIISYIGKREACPILIDGLTALEYRGYDSAGIFIPGAGSVKSVGAVENLRKKIPVPLQGRSGIAHLRWATHGEPTETNAHPHSDCGGNFWVVHNGIIENYQELKKKLVALGHVFVSDTDTEVISHMIEEKFKETSDFEEAVKKMLAEIKGTYGLAMAYKKDPNKIMVAKMGAPVALGIGNGEIFVASDPSPILRHTKNILYLHDREFAILRSDGYDIFNFDNQKVDHVAEVIEWNEGEAKKGGFEHFMLKEIMEGPEVIENTIRGRLVPDDGTVKLGGLESVARQLKDVKRIIIVGCGTAYYTGQIGEYMIEEYAGIPVETEVGSEFRYRRPIIDKDTLLLAISQSGETADTLEAIREAKRKGAMAIGIVNVVGSTIARETDAGIYNHAGPEVGVASTKAFISQVTALALLTIFLGRQRGMSLDTGKTLVQGIKALPDALRAILAQTEIIKALAKEYALYDDFLYIGRKYNSPIAYEGALKLKEVSYIHAEGYGAGEMKHGPLAMIDEHFPTVAICLDDTVRDKMISNIQEIKARKGKVIAIVTEGDDSLVSLADKVLYIPKTMEMLSPIVSIVPLQLFAYYIAVERGLNVDRPRNLAKSVTVE